MFSAVRYFYPPTSLCVNYSAYSCIKIKPFEIGRVQQAALFSPLCAAWSRQDVASLFRLIVPPRSRQQRQIDIRLKSEPASPQDRRGSVTCCGLNWRFFLTCRVRINGLQSKKLSSSTGSPQGCVLCPLQKPAWGQAYPEICWWYSYRQSAPQTSIWTRSSRRWVCQMLTKWRGLSPIKSHEDKGCGNWFLEGKHPTHHLRCSLKELALDLQNIINILRHTCMSWCKLWCSV